MKKLLIYLIIRITTRHAITALKIYESIYTNNKHNNVVKKSNLTLNKNTTLCVDSKKKEIIDSLKYLKTKKIKSKQDKSSISMLEGVLATM